jgi:hypothetical protein
MAALQDTLPRNGEQLATLQHVAGRADDAAATRDALREWQRDSNPLTS